MTKYKHPDILRTAHDRLGYLGYKKVLSIIRKNFTWSRLASDVKAYCSECEVCQRSNKAVPRRALMVERPVINRPFEQIALNKVGPLPKAKGGARFIVTVVCMATRWPEVVPLCNITAKGLQLTSLVTWAYPYRY